MDDERWRRRAVCHSVPTAVFFDDDDTAAAAVCAGCPVQRACLDDALSAPSEIDQGFRAGLTEGERLMLRTGGTRVPSPIRHGTESGARAHRRRGEDPCKECRDGERSAGRDRAEQRRLRLAATA